MCKEHFCYERKNPYTNEIGKKHYFRLLLEKDYSHSKKIIFSATEKEKISQALQTAYSMRNIEIELLWKRAAHFWLFIAAIGYIYCGFISFILDKEILKNVQGQTQEIFSFALASQIQDLFGVEFYTLFFVTVLTFINIVGVITSYIWLEVIRSSRFWTEHWENHIDMLEFEFTGHLHKIILKNTTKLPMLSGAKLNIALAFMCILVWIVCECFVTLLFLGNNINALMIILVVYLLSLYIIHLIITKTTKSRSANPPL